MIPLTYSKAVQPLLRRVSDRFYSLVRLIFSDLTSKNLFLFLLINVSFAFVELSYGLWTNSLGLISDAFHMFLDSGCLAGSLAASIISKWRPNERFSFGYVRVEVLASFVNGMFLVFVAFFILSEAVERAFEPPEVKHEKLFVVSCLGLLINLGGIYAFQHGHGHRTGSHNHSHGHDSPAQSHLMKGIFLHILADALGSVSVILSSLLVQHFGLLRADPVCSIFIAILILLSVWPLIQDSAVILMERQPVALDSTLPKCYQKVMQLAGVYSIQEPHFWTLCSDNHVGMLKLEISSAADSKYILSQMHMIFSSVGVRQLYVQLDYAPCDLFY